MYRFPHESLHTYADALHVASWIRSLKWPRGDGSLGDQARRASASVVLNIAEGRSQTGRSRKHHYRIATASAAEVCAALDLLDHPDSLEHQCLLRSIAQRLVELSR